MKYNRPYTIEEIKEYYPKQADQILRDPVHVWRAKTGIELIHKEPTLKKQKRIWLNWQLMTDEQKKISDQKSLEIFGIINSDHYQNILASEGVAFCA